MKPATANTGTAPDERHLVLLMGSQPIRMTCPYCHANIQTIIESEPNTRTHLLALSLCCLCLICGG